MRKFLTVLLSAALLITLACCGSGQEDPFDDLWNTSNTSSGRHSSSEAASSVAPESDPVAGIEISLPDESDLPNESSSTDPVQESPEAPKTESSTPANESSATSRNESSASPKSESSATSRNESSAMSKTESSTPKTESSATSKTESSHTSKTESSATSKTESSSKAESSGDGTSSDVSGDNSGDNSTEEPDNPDPVFVTAISYDSDITIYLPEGWSVLKKSGYDLEVASASRSEYLSASASGLGDVSGLTEEEIFEAMFEEAKITYSKENGYTVSKGTVSLNSKKHSVITIQKANNSELYRQVAYLLSGNHLVTVTVMVSRSANAKTVWTFIDKA